MRVAVGNDVTVVSPVVVGVDGETIEDADGSPVVSVTRSDGTALPAPTVAHIDTGRYTALLTADEHLNIIDQLTLEWSLTTDLSGATRLWRVPIDVVGARYASIPELRADPGMPDAAKFSTPALLDALDAVEEFVERAAGVAFVRRCAVESFRARGGSVFVPAWPMIRELRRVTIDGEPVEDATFDAGCIRRESGFPAGASVTVVYVHGHDFPPGRLVEEVVREVRSRVAQTRLATPAQAIWQQIDGVIWRFSTPDPAAGRPTGNLGLDAVIASLSMRTPGVA